ncbi:hypothetical protein HK098_004505 [Nowakowskiella sp. JEL0407]|nr:hypothetical protein HK098_004505 [Nowakowskiella sp. JEL0407]
MGDKAEDKPPMTSKQIKAVFRNTMKLKLSQIPLDQVQNESKVVTSLILKAPFYKSSERISIYTSMPTSEISTFELIADSIRLGKKVYIPRYSNTKEKNLMEMRRVIEGEVEQIVPNRWDIKEGGEGEDAMEEEGVDLVVVPGVAFTVKGGRLGHGKGYYDRYLSRLNEKRMREGRDPAITVGVGLAEQIVEEVEQEEHDVMMKYIVSSNLGVIKV